MNWIPTYRTTSAVLTFCIILLAVVSYFFLLQPEIPLFYSLARLEDQVVQKEWIFLIPGLAISSLILERILTPLLKQDDTSLEILSSVTTLTLLVFATALIRVLVLTI